MRANVASPKRKAKLTVVETGEAAVLRHLGTRRSTSAAALTEPGPDRATLESMLTIAVRVPDHKKLAPWRFIVIEGAARARFGALLAQTCSTNEPEASDARHEIERGRFLRAPVVVAVVSSPVYHPAAPEWEQVLSAGAVCLNLLHAASAYGFGAQWISEWYAYDEQVKRGFGLKDGERIAGFIYIGTAREKPTERDRPELSAITSFPEGPQE